MANYSTRNGITYDQVVEAARTLLAKRIIPTIRNIREAVGGSPNTIHKHLTAWREANPSPFVPMLSPSIIKALTQEIAKITTEACSASDGLLAQYKKESVQLAAVGELLEFENHRLLEQVATLTAERDRLVGKTEEQALSLQKLSFDLEHEIRASEQARATAENLNTQISSLKTSLDEQAKSVEVLSRVLDIEKLGKIDAEKNVAVLKAQLEAAREYSRKTPPKTKVPKVTIEQP